ncbi:unnamed protein product [Clonostachys rhizophaga]|uniref:Protein kinase domain-containing protein n=1 Tax=Clonostachys rhizophaga TaxID=160324 RepID=A0A9N9V9P9_9HYPO|nr:unnamed protein product [Clonostachys rhizophaga]
MQTILPFTGRPGDCLSVGPSQGLVYTIDDDIVIKVPFQYPISQNLDSHLLDLSLKSFRCTPCYKPIRIPTSYDGWKVTNLIVSSWSGFTPLEAAWPHSTESDRRRWALELLGAISWLEGHGWANGDLAVRNLGVDTTNRLKVFDFGSSINNSHPDYANDIVRDHFDLATCLNYILSGIDPFATARSYRDVKKIRTELMEGRGSVGQGAEVLAGIIQGGWTGRGSSTGFRQLLEQASDIFGPLTGNILPEHQEGHYERLESRCRDWLRKSSRNEHWKDVDGYLLSCKSAGHEADLEIWR